jgi:hypothetical protein
MFALAHELSLAPALPGEGIVVIGGLALLAGLILAAGLLSRRQAKMFDAAQQPVASRTFRFEKSWAAALGNRGWLPPGLWQTRLANRMQGTLHLHGNGTFQADLVAFGLLGRWPAATETARGRWYTKGNGVLFQVDSGAAGLPFASGLLEIVDAGDSGFSVRSAEAQFEFGRVSARRGGPRPEFHEHCG